MTRNDHLLDPLTGIYSRASMKSRLLEEVDRAERYGQPFSILLLDLDHFKSVNDAFGHARGDEVLVELARRLQEASRRSDIVFRYGGDEFLALLPNTNNDQAEIIAERLRTMLSETPYPGQPNLSLTVSMGIACFPKDSHTPEGLFDIADKRHYAAKRAGRNQFVSKDIIDTDELYFDSLSRLIERDEALGQAHQFLDELLQNRNGIFEIAGRQGTGKIRFINEAAKIARLQGLLVLPIQSRPALKVRVLGTLLTAESGWEGLPSVLDGTDGFIESLQQILDDKGYIGVVFTLQEIESTDPKSLSFIEEILFAAKSPRIGLIYTTSKQGYFSPTQREAAVWRSTEIKPFSPRGVQIWLRHILQWEPPREFSDWLYNETGGLPAYLKQGVLLLQGESKIVKSNSRWELSKEIQYASTPLAYMLEEMQERKTTNIPLDLSMFVGRVKEIGELKQHLLSQQIVTLLGGGGIGKSRLAVQVATEMADSFPAGVYLVSLPKPQTTSSQEPYLYQAILQTLQLPPDNQQSSLKQLTEHLGGKKIILILDGFEAVQDNIQNLSQLVQKTKTAKFLVTSREPLNLPEEFTYEIAGFACPNDYQPGMPVNQYESLQLFMHVAQQIDPTFTIGEHNAGAIAKICQLVGGIPLGIELAASWVEMFAPHKIAEKIERNLGFLSKDDASNTPSRPRSLRAVFDYFWNMLAENEQVTLQYLSTFIDHFDARAAREIAGASPFFLGALTTRVFLTKSPSGKYRIHETLRRYAAEKLRKKPHLKEEALQRHCEYYINYLTERIDQMQTNRQQEALLEIRDAFGNIQNSWLNIIKTLDYQALDASMDGLYLYFGLSSNYRAGQNLFRNCVNHLSEHGLRQDPLFERVINRARARLAVFLDYLGKYSESEKLLQSCLASARTRGDQIETAFCLTRLAYVNLLRGKNHETIREMLQEARQIYYAEDFKPGVVRVLSLLATLVPAQESLVLLKEKMGLAEELGNSFGMAETQVAIGNLYEKMGQTEVASQNIHQAIATFEKLNSSDGVAGAYFSLGTLAIQAGKYSQARTHLIESRDTYRQTGNMNGIAAAAGMLCRVAIAEGNFESAKQDLRNSLVIEQKIDNQQGVASAYNWLGFVEIQQNHLNQAEKTLQKAHQILSESGDKRELSRVLLNQARLKLICGELAQAKQIAEQALQQATELDEFVFLMRAHLLMAEIHLEQQSPLETEPHLKISLRKAIKRNSPRYLLECLVPIGKYEKQYGDPEIAAHALNIATHHSAATYQTSEAAKSQLEGLPSPSERLTISTFVERLIQQRDYASNHQSPKPQG